MAEPQDSAVNFFEDFAAYKVQYHDKVESQWDYFGKATTDLFDSIEAIRLDSDSYEVTLEDQPVTNVRVSNDILADAPSPSAYTFDTYTVSLRESGANNHIRKLHGSVRTNDVEITRAKTPMMKAQLIQRLLDGTDKDRMENLALHRQLDSNSTIATISGDPVQNDAFYYADGTAHTNQTSVRAKITGRIAAFKQGMVVDVRNSGGADYAANGEDLSVTDVNVHDRSVALVGAADLAALTDGDTIHRSNNYGNNIISLDAWFEGETSIYGVDRSVAGNRYLIPIRINANSGNWTEDYYRQLALSMGYTRSNARQPWRLHCTPELWYDIKGAIDEKTVIHDVLSNEQKTGTVGIDGIFFRDPLLGVLRLQTDEFLPEGTVRLYDPSTWKTLWCPTKRPRWMPGEIGSYWYRLKSTTAATMFYQADFYQALADICTAPRKNAQIYGLNQTN